MVKLVYRDGNGIEKLMGRPRADSLGRKSQNLIPMSQILVWVMVMEKVMDMRLLRDIALMWRMDECILKEVRISF